MHGKRNIVSVIVMTILAIIILLKVMSGSLINHAAQLKLDEIYINEDWLMSRYGMGKIQPDVSFLIDNKMFSQFGH